MERVTSRSNPVVKRFREIARDGRDGDTVLLDGPHLIDEALRSAIVVEIVACAESRSTVHAGLVARSAAAGARIVALPDALLEAVSPVRHAAGVVALARLSPVPLGDALAASPQLVVVLEGVQDPGNVGAVIRAAEACGATAVIAGPGTADPFGWRALRGSMGSAFRLPVAAVASSDEALSALRDAGIRTFAAVPRGGTPLRRAPLARPSAVLLGGEGAGLAPSLVAQADEALTIEMRAPVESLNVSVAAALILYEASRQRADVAVR